jgi:hypothetical protein
VTPEIRDYLGELRRYSLQRKTAILDCDTMVSGSFSYDFPRIFAEAAFHRPDEFRLAEPRIFQLSHDLDQRQTIRGYVGQYGETLAGLGRVLMKLPIHRIFRTGHMETDGTNDESPTQPAEPFVPSNMVMGF